MILWSKRSLRVDITLCSYLPKVAMPCTDLGTEKEHCIFLFVLLFRNKHPVAQADLEFDKYSVMTLDSLFFCLHLPSAGMAHATPHVYWGWGLTSGLWACDTGALQTEAHPQPQDIFFFWRKKKQCDLVLLTMYWGKFQLGLKTPVIKNENKLKEAYGISVERKSLLNTENIEVVIRGKDGYLYKYNSENKIWRSLFK